jgi:hypothetical protein
LTINRRVTHHQFELLQAGKGIYGELVKSPRLGQEQRRHGIVLSLPARVRLRLPPPGGRPRNNIQPGKYSRSRANVWEYPCASTFSKTGEEGNPAGDTDTCRRQLCFTRRTVRKSPGWKRSHYADRNRVKSGFGYPVEWQRYAYGGSNPHPMPWTKVTILTRHLSFLIDFEGQWHGCRSPRINGGNGCSSDAT